MLNLPTSLALGRNCVFAVRRAPVAVRVRQCSLLTPETVYGDRAQHVRGKKDFYFKGTRGTRVQCARSRILNENGPMCQHRERIDCGVWRRPKQIINISLLRVVRVHDRRLCAWLGTV